MATRRLKIDDMCLGLKPKVRIATRKSAIAIKSSPKGPDGRR